MYVQNSSAYQLDRYIETKVDKKAELERKRQIKVKRFKKKLTKVLAITFAIVAVIVLRSVHIYDLHNTINEKTAMLNEIVAKNEQAKLDIESMTDKSKISAYAENTLGLKKTTSAQVVYLTPQNQNVMKNVSNSGSSSGGIKGFFAGILEYFK